jgi:hypothetical protein
MRLSLFMYDAAKEDLDRFLGEAVRKIKEAKRRQ